MFQRRLLKEQKAPVSLRPVFVRAVLDHQTSNVVEAVSVIGVVPGITSLNTLCWPRKIHQAYF